MIWRLVGHWLSFLVPTFYKRIETHDLHRLYTGDPVIVAMNHPNAFTDPIAISYRTFPFRLYYMARGDAFKSGLISWLLEQIGIVPIFRIQDAGKEGLKRNDEAYRRVNRLLERNGKVIVFAEGLCVQERRLRPLKKGVARMVFGAYEHLAHDRLKVIPIGVNYSKPDKFRSKILYNVGPAISVSNYIALYKENPARAYNLFLQDLQKAMLEQVLHIPRQDLDDTVHYAEKLGRAEMIRRSGLPRKKLYSEYLMSRQIVSQLEKAELHQPELLAQFASKARAYFEELKKVRLKDWLLRPEQQSHNTWPNLIFRYFVILLVLPVYITGMVFNFPPLALSGIVTRKIVKNPEFFSSFALGIGAVLFPLFYVTWFVIFYKIFDNLIVALLSCLIAGLCGWASLFIHPMILRAKGLWRFLRLGPEAARLTADRAELLRILNKF